ncbi:hypothetical protein [Streptomyces sp. VRA16 Mangrove soil]|uniref:hypothetical protein n=1 Tax=Streptomyces sp. VRA16 Mangrove soil TaxID=2817434 RepID=UPI001A9DA928|nr:hypothetical protein [Streptomyces sp. VRA16 Mangrove soil]MBO1332764.1 hypothetical protein [Streptomyces sp. VRA16 Mangrove soil]
MAPKKYTRTSEAADPDRAGEEGAATSRGALVAVADGCRVRPRDRVVSEAAEAVLRRADSWRPGSRCDEGDRVSRRSLPLVALWRAAGDGVVRLRGSTPDRSGILSFDKGLVSEVSRPLVHVSFLDIARPVM